MICILSAAQFLVFMQKLTYFYITDIINDDDDADIDDGDDDADGISSTSS